MLRSRALVLAILLGLAGCGPGTGGAAGTTVTVPPGAVNRDVEVVATGEGDFGAAVAQLRRAGWAGLDALAEEYARSQSTPERAARLRAAMDRVAMQRDAHASRLYWYTDLDAAKEAAKREGKPILELRLLGRLDEELSCANSRFFRTALYPNANVSKTMREKFILLWTTERPAPVITIDFGDGRKIRRTVTGNSLHYVRDAEGRPIDAIPGLYGPEHFVRALEAAEPIARESPKLPASERAELVRRFHEQQMEESGQRWQLASANLGLEPGVLPLPKAWPAALGAPPTAAVAMVVPMSKMALERPVVLRIAPLGQAPDDKVDWDAVGQRLAGADVLDANARRAMRDKRPMDWTGGTPKPLGESEIAAMIAKFEHTMAADTAKNELSIHYRLHQWFVAKPDLSFDELDKDVYAELFLTPKTDPWLGLVPPGVFSGIEGDGVAK